jgi:hypothetical protein
MSIFCLPRPARFVRPQIRLRRIPLRRSGYGGLTKVLKNCKSKCRKEQKKSKSKPGLSLT